MSVIIDQLRISDNGKKMYINVHVNKAEPFNGVYLESITIMTADKVSETNPGSPTEDYIYKKTFDIGTESAALELIPSRDFNEQYTRTDMGSTLFFVYITTNWDNRDGNRDCCIPCRLDELTTVGVTFDEKLLHQKVMGYTKDLVQDCNVPHAFIDFILRWNAFKSSIETEHWIQALKFYKLLFDNAGGSFNSIKRCGCHG